MFSKLLVPLDGSSFAEQAIRPAAMIARACHASVELVLAHQPMAFAEIADAAWQADPSRGERAYVAETARKLSEGAGISVHGSAIRGLASDAIVQHAQTVGADLVVMTSHGRTGLSRAWLGSVAHEVIRQSRIPVLVVRPAPGKRQPSLTRSGIKRILVTLDGSPLSEAVLDSAKELARAFRARLILLRIVEPVLMILPEVDLPARDLPRDKEKTALAVGEATHALAAVAKRLTGAGDVRVETHVVVARSAAKAILEFARRAVPSLIAMSTHGRGASRLLLGSVSDKVLRGSTAAMLICRPLVARPSAP